MVAFDEEAGLGAIRADGDGRADEREYSFHCTQIADGTRRIALGASVRFRLVAGRRGRWEATEVGVAGAEEVPPA